MKKKDSKKTVTSKFIESETLTQIKQADLDLIKGGTQPGDGWWCSISGECSGSQRSCWTIEGIADWATGH